MTYKYDVTLFRLGVTQREVENGLRGDVLDDGVCDANETPV